MRRSLKAESKFPSVLLAAILATASGTSSADNAPARGRERPAEAYVVGAGDTLSALALRFHVAEKDLCEANRIKGCDKLREGQKLVIPARTRDADRDAAGRAAGGAGAAGRGSPAGSETTAHASSAREYASYGPPVHHPGVVHLIHGTETLQIRTLDRHGRVLSTARKALEGMLRSYRTGARHPIDPRLIQLITDVSDHFGGRPMLVVSGFRPYSPTQYTPHSNHNAGRAIDFTIPGVSNQVLRDYCRKFSNVGVGYYPNSSFVHMDVRDANAFWIDYAGPGEPPRYHHPESRDEADEGAGEVSAELPMGELGDPHGPNAAHDSPAGTPGLEGSSGSRSTQIDRSASDQN